MPAHPFKNREKTSESANRKTSPKASEAEPFSVPRSTNKWEATDYTRDYDEGSLIIFLWDNQLMVAKLSGRAGLKTRNAHDSDELRSFIVTPLNNRFTRSMGILRKK